MGYLKEAIKTFRFLGGIVLAPQAMPPISTQFSTEWSVCRLCLSVCLSVCHICAPCLNG